MLNAIKPSPELISVMNIQIFLKISYLFNCEYIQALITPSIRLIIYLCACFECVEENGR